MKNNLNILDCTFRDGGYYNNWNFDKKIIQKYLYEIEKLGIKYVELGFRTLDKVRVKGENAYTTDRFLENFKIPKNLNIGVMVNASDLFFDNNTLYNCKKIFFNKTSKVRFIRLACHLHEVYHLKNVIKWLKNKGFMVCINLMQISEIKKSEIKKVCRFLKKTNIDVLYVADSLGSLNSKKISNLIKSFKKNWSSDIGFHAHNNLKLAFTNAIKANNLGLKWIDSTIQGMGRGPGNLITEEILAYIHKNKKKKFFSNQIQNYFLNLKKKYKWGPNKYYAIAARNKIHPTYIQKMLSDKRYKKLNYLNIVNSLKKTETSKYNPIKHFKNVFFTNKMNPNSKLLVNDNQKKILILGPGNSVKENKIKIQKFIKKNSIYVIALNTTNSISEKFINLRAACHPLRIISDIPIYKKFKTKIVIPYSSFNNSIKHLIKSNNLKFYDYGLKLNLKNEISIKRKYCILPYPLVIGYVLSLLSNNGKTKLYFAGIDGFDINDPDSDNTIEIFNFFIKKIIKKKFVSLTPTKYKKTFKLLKL